MVASEARLEARVLLQAALNKDRAWLLAHGNNALDAEAHNRFETLLTRRLRGEPIAYIVGTREFYGLQFRVTPATLIPRPDTETLVEAALARMAADSACSVLDLGTGSGAIAIAIAAARPQAKVTAVDRSSDALQVAQDNAKCLNIVNVALLQSDWFSALDNRRFDLIVSNPPYIAADDLHLQQGDLRFEPLTALAAGADGLDCIRVIVAEAKTHLYPRGWLLLEHGYDQAAQVRALLGDAGYDEVTSLCDLAAIERITLGRLG